MKQINNKTDAEITAEQAALGSKRIALVFYNWALRHVTFVWDYGLDDSLKHEILESGIKTLDEKGGHT